MMPAQIYVCTAETCNKAITVRGAKDKPDAQFLACQASWQFRSTAFTRANGDMAAFCPTHPFFRHTYGPAS